LIFLTVDLYYCIKTKDLYDSSGNFLRSVCVVENYAKHIEADSRCQIYGMQLYNVDTDEVQKALLDFTNTQYSTSKNTSFYIAGVNCMAVMKNTTEFKLYNVQCEFSCYFFCQYNISTKTSQLGKYIIFFCCCYIHDCY
jgi:hypothetical protein